jgi:hypothetical protein
MMYAGQPSIIMVEMFPTRVRYPAFPLGYQVTLDRGWITRSDHRHQPVERVRVFVVPVALYLSWCRPHHHRHHGADADKTSASRCIDVDAADAERTQERVPSRARSRPLFASSKVMDRWRGEAAGSLKARTTRGRAADVHGPSDRRAGVFRFAPHSSEVAGRAASQLASVLCVPAISRWIDPITAFHQCRSKRLLGSGHRPNVAAAGESIRQHRGEARFPLTMFGSRPIPAFRRTASVCAKMLVAEARLRHREMWRTDAPSCGPEAQIPHRRRSCGAFRSFSHWHTLRAWISDRATGESSW